MTPSDFAAYPTGAFCNADPRVRVFASAIVPLIPGRRIAGPARTARILPGQNGAIHRAVRDAQPGELLVVDGGASERFGPFGDLLAEACLMKGMAGAVFDCTVRDAADIAALGFQVFCRGFHPEPTTKGDPGETGVPVIVGGVAVAPGDMLVGDDDGVVAIPASAGADVLAKVARIAAREEQIRVRIRAGETTYAIFGLTHE